MTVERGNAGDGGKDCPDFQHEGEGSIFSRNLELDFNSPSMSPVPRQSPGFTGDGLDLEERLTYFQIEASKVVDILRGELDRFGSLEGAQALVDDLWHGWRELWGTGLGAVEQEFTAMFRVVRGAYEAAARRGGTELSQPEKLALGRVMQGMEKLAGGESDEETLQWCREAGNRVLRMIAAWDNVEDGGSPELKPSQQPQPEEDISASIDEWFSQVSRFIPHSPEDDQETETLTSFIGGELEPDEPEPDRDFLLEQSSASLESPPAQEVETTEPGPPPGGEQEAPPALDESPAAPTPVGEQGPAGDDRIIERRDTAEENCAAARRPEDIVGESASEGWLSEVYFSECCLEAAEAIHNNADRLEGASSARTARMLRDWVEYLLRLSADFGIAEADLALNALWMRLEEIASAGGGGRSSDAARVEELLGALSTLERECERVAVSAC